MLKRNPRDPDYVDEVEQENEQAVADLYQRTATEQATVAQPRTESRAPGVRAESVIDAQSTFDGRFVAEADLRIEGSVSGEVICRGLLTIEREAEAKAKVESRDARILGHVDGEISCSGRLELAPTAVVKGTIRAATLVIQEGASLIGNVETKAPGARPELRSLESSRKADARTEEQAADEVASASEPPTRERNGRPRAVPSFALSPSDPAPNGRERN